MAKIYKTCECSAYNESECVCGAWSGAYDVEDDEATRTDDPLGSALPACSATMTRHETQMMVLKGVLIDNCGPGLLPEVIAKLIVSLENEIKNSSQAWAFK